MLLPIPWLVGRSKIGIGDVLSMSFQGSVFTVIWKMFHKLPDKGAENFKNYMNAYKFNHRFLRIELGLLWRRMPNKEKTTRRTSLQT